MVVNALIRLFKGGEIIYSKYNPETGKFSNIPESIFKFPIFGEEWPWSPHPSGLEESDDVYCVMEKMILQDSDITCIITIGGIAFFVQKGAEIFTAITEDIGKMELYNSEGYVAEGIVDIGIRRTVRKCFSEAPYQEHLAYDTASKKIITSEGMFALESIDVNSITAVPKDIDAKLQRDLNLHGFGVIWINGAPTNVDIHNNLTISKS